MRRAPAALLPLLLLPAAALAAGDGEEDPLGGDRLPALWRIESRTEAAPAQVAAIGKRLGAAVERLENVVLDAGGIRLQVNLARCPEEEDAARLERRFAALHGPGPWSARRGRDVAEIVCASRPAAARALAVLGWGPAPEATWKVRLSVAPLERSSDGDWNRLYRRLAGAGPPEEEGGEESLAALAARFTFADAVLLPTAAAPWGRPSWTFRPAPEGEEERGAATRYRFAPLPRKEGVPVLAVEGTVPVRAFAPRPGPADPRALTAATEAWPAGDPAVAARVEEVLPPGKPFTPRARVERLLARVRRDLEYAGGEAGTRDGVLRVLERGRGRCWDHADVLVTLCRAAGIPAREIGGWLPGIGGHVWTEILVEGEGWTAVDPTCSWLGVSEEYVPLWSTDDGRVPYVFRAVPVLERTVPAGK